ncbi:MAG: hypothetical protein WCG91_03155 [Candidatus Shapirobacteria bacterium]
MVNKPKAKKLFKVSYFVILHIFALVGIIFIGVFFAIRLKLTDVPGKVDKLSSVFEQNNQNQILGATSQIASDSGKLAIDSDIERLTKLRDIKIKNLCSLEELTYISPKNVKKILQTRKINNSDYIFSQMIFALETHLVDKDSYDKNVKICVDNFSNKGILEADIETQIKDTDSQIC